MEIIRISIIGIAGIAMAMMVKEIRPEYAIYLSLTAGVLILFFTVGKLSFLVESVQKIQEYIPIESAYITILMKMIGITYIGQFASGICKDAGYSAVAGQIELFGKLSVLAVSMPVVTALLETIYEFLG